MSRLIMLVLLLLACSYATHAATDDVIAVTLEMRQSEGRAAIVFYAIRGEWRRPSQCVVCKAGSAYRIGVRILQPHQDPAGFEVRLQTPSAPGWARWAAQVRRVWDNITDHRIRWSVPRVHFAEALR